MSTFKTTDVANFLKSSGYEQLSNVFVEKFNIERVQKAQVVEWFGMNIIRDDPAKLFRHMECVVVQHMELGKKIC
jgi:hypothetical protein